MGVTWSVSWYTGASGPTDEELMVVPVSAMPAMSALLGTPFLMGPSMPVIFRIRKSTVVSSCPALAIPRDAKSVTGQGYSTI
jgi:hypothetical protein